MKKERQRKEEWQNDKSNEKGNERKAMGVREKDREQKRK